MVTSVGAIRRVLGFLKLVGLDYQMLDSDCMRCLFGYFQFVGRKRLRDSSYRDSMIAECLVRKESNKRAVDTRR
jgi:hypothetical protein